MIVVELRNPQKKQCVKIELQQERIGPGMAVLLRPLLPARNKAVQSGQEFFGRFFLRKRSGFPARLAQSKHLGVHGAQCTEKLALFLSNEPPCLQHGGFVQRRRIHVAGAID